MTPAARAAIAVARSSTAEASGEKPLAQYRVRLLLAMTEHETLGRETRRAIGQARIPLPSASWKRQWYSGCRLETDRSTEPNPRQSDIPGVGIAVPMQKFRRRDGSSCERFERPENPCDAACRSRAQMRCLPRTGRVEPAASRPTVTT